MASFDGVQGSADDHFNIFNAVDLVFVGMAADPCGRFVLQSLGEARRDGMMGQDHQVVGLDTFNAFQMLIISTTLGLGQKDEVVWKARKRSHVLINDHNIGVPLGSKDNPLVITGNDVDGYG